MDKYIVLNDIHLLTGEEFNINTRVRLLEDEDAENTTSIFRKVYMNISKFTNDALMYNITSSMVLFRIASRDEFKTNKTVGKNDELDTIYGIFYKPIGSDDKVINAKLIIAKDGQDEEACLKELEEYADNNKFAIKENSVIISRVGHVLKSDANMTIEDKDFIITFDEQKMGALIMKKGLDSFNEFNHKMYIVGIEEVDPIVIDAEPGKDA